MLEALAPFTGTAEPVEPESAPPAPEKPAPSASNRVRLTGKDKERFDKATAEYAAAKNEQRVKIFEYAATTEEHKDAKDSGLNIKAQLVEDYYNANPDVDRYFGKKKTVEAPVNRGLQVFMNQSGR